MRPTYATIVYNNKPYPLNSPRIRIGSSITADIRITDPGVQRVHAEIMFVPSRIANTNASLSSRYRPMLNVFNEKAKSSTFVNHKVIITPINLANQDIITIGLTRKHHLLFITDYGATTTASMLATPKSESKHCVTSPRNLITDFNQCSPSRSNRPVWLAPKSSIMMTTPDSSIKVPDPRETPLAKRVLTPRLTDQTPRYSPSIRQYFRQLNSKSNQIIRNIERIYSSASKPPTEAVKVISKDDGDNKSKPIPKVNPEISLIDQAASDKLSVDVKGNATLAAKKCLTDHCLEKKELSSGEDSEMTKEERRISKQDFLNKIEEIFQNINIADVRQTRPSLIKPIPYLEPNFHKEAEIGSPRKLQSGHKSPPPSLEQQELKLESPNLLNNERQAVRRELEKCRKTTSPLLNETNKVEGEIFPKCDKTNEEHCIELNKEPCNESSLGDEPEANDGRESVVVVETTRMVSETIVEMVSCKGIDAKEEKANACHGDDNDGDGKNTDTQVKCSVLESPLSRDNKLCVAETDRKCEIKTSASPVKHSASLQQQPSVAVSPNVTRCRFKNQTPAANYDCHVQYIGNISHIDSQLAAPLPGSGCSKYLKDFFHLVTIPQPDYNRPFLSTVRKLFNTGTPPKADYESYVDGVQWLTATPCSKNRKNPESDVGTTLPPVRKVYNLRKRTTTLKKLKEYGKKSPGTPVKAAAAAAAAVYTPAKVKRKRKQKQQPTSIISVAIGDNFDFDTLAKNDSSLLPDIHYPSFKQRRTRKNNRRGNNLESADYSVLNDD